MSVQRRSLISSSAGWLRYFGRAAADFVYPPACRLCQTQLIAEPDASGQLFCNGCHEGLHATRTLAACDHCGASIGPHIDPKEMCTFCRHERYAFERVFRLGVYDGDLRTAVLRAKQRGAESLAAALGELVWDCEGSLMSAAQIDVVLPVPQHWTQRLFRPQNAAHTLAEVWARRLQVPLATHILRKTRRTRPQARLVPSERRVNLRRAFAAAPQSFAGACVLLADDVLTTGTTAHEAARVLKQAGAARVLVTVVARGLGRR